MNNRVKEIREEFFLKNYDLFEDGTFREVYTGDTLSIYAVAERTYAVIPFMDKLPDDMYMYFGITAVEVRELLQDEAFFARIFEHFRSQNNVPLLTPSAKRKMHEWNASSLQEGQWSITPEFEEKLFPPEARSKNK